MTFYNHTINTEGNGKFIQITAAHNQPVRVFHKTANPIAGVILFGFLGKLCLEVDQATGTVSREITDRDVDKILVFITDVSNALI